MMSVVQSASAVGHPPETQVRRLERASSALRGQPPPRLVPGIAPNALEPLSAVSPVLPSAQHAKRPAR